MLKPSACTCGPIGLNEMNFQQPVAHYFRQIGLACCLILAILHPALAGFDSQLGQFRSLLDKGAHPALLSAVQAAGPSMILEDLRLFLMAEAQRNSGQEAAAMATFEQLIQRFPESLGGRRALFPYLVLAAKVKGLPALPTLQKLARGLPTAYQRGRVYEAFWTLPADARSRSILALEGVRAYHSDSWFYQNVPESVDFLKLLFANCNQLHLTGDEWIELIRTANRENLGQLTARILPFLQVSLGTAGEAVSQVLQADALRTTGQKERANQILAGLLASTGISPGIRALAYQVRGDLYSSMNRHDLASADFARALTWEQQPVDVVAARYRLMRSAFEAGFDQQSLEAAEKLCADHLKIPLLPVHLFEMGLKRYDEGKTTAAIPFFKLMASAFPGHYRADDALGFAAIASGINFPEGKNLLGKLAANYPHSFFLYWLDPASRNLPMPGGRSLAPPPSWLQSRVSAWQILLKSPFADWAREEIRQLQDDYPTEPGLFKTLMELYWMSGDYNQVTACGERLLKNTLDSGKSAATMPLWAWQGYFPRPFWPQVQNEAKRNGIDPLWILSIMREESHFNPQTLSKSNAMGLMQILPSTGKWIAGKLGIKGKFSHTSLWDISRNISFGAWYLKYLQEMFNGDLFLASASYNGGQGNITRKVEQGPYASQPVLSRLDRVPLPETRDYYKKVMGSWWCYHRLYAN